MFRIAAAAPPAPPAQEAVLGEGDVEVVDHAPAAGGDGFVEELEEVDESAGDAPAPDREADDPFDGQDVTDRLEQKVRGELSEGEKIVWVGRPSLRLMKGPGAPDLIFGSVFVLCGFLAFGGALRLLLDRNTPPCLMFVGAAGCVLFGGFLVVLGALVLLFPWRCHLFPRRRPIYVLTDRGALVVHCFIWKVRRYRPSDLARRKLRKSEGFEGAGDLVFEFDRETRYENGPGGPARIVKSPRGFLHLENVRGVERIVRATLPDRRGLD